MDLWGILGKIPANPYKSSLIGVAQGRVAAWMDNFVYIDGGI
jgi:hypothetical protein